MEIPKPNYHFALYFQQQKIPLTILIHKYGAMIQIVSWKLKLSPLTTAPND